MTTKPWTPEDEPRLRQEAIERAEAAEKGPLAEIVRYIPEAEYLRLLRTIADQADAIARLTAALPQPPTKDQPQEPKE